jgi:hypothetical protein
MVQHGYGQLGAALTLAGHLRHEIGALPRLHVVIDVSGLGVTGYDVADWLREQHRIDMGLSDHRRVEATLSLADDETTAGRLVSALAASPGPAPTCPARPKSTCPVRANSNSNPRCSPATPSSPLRKPSPPAMR